MRVTFTVFGQDKATIERLALARLEAFAGRVLFKFERESIHIEANISQETYDGKVIMWRGSVSAALDEPPRPSLGAIA